MASKTGSSKQEKTDIQSISVSVLLTPDLHKVVKERARSQGMSISTYVRVMIIKDLEAQKRKNE